MFCLYFIYGIVNRKFKYCIKYECGIKCCRNSNDVDGMNVDVVEGMNVDVVDGMNMKL